VWICGSLNAASDFDLYLFDSSGAVVKDVRQARGGAGGGAGPGPAGHAHRSPIQVVAYDVVTGAGGDQYTATIQLLPTPSARAAAAATVAGRPRYEDYAAPAAMGNGAGEPTLGVNRVREACSTSPASTR
jgi:hypothetical protein